MSGKIMDLFIEIFILTDRLNSQIMQVITSHIQHSLMFWFPDNIKFLSKILDDGRTLDREDQ